MANLCDECADEVMFVKVSASIKKDKLAIREKSHGIVVTSLIDVVDDFCLQWISVCNLFFY